MILDTSFVLDVWDGDQNAIRTHADLHDRRVRQKLSSMTIFELTHGVVRADKPADERKRVLAVAESKPIVPAGERVMASAGRLHGQLQNDGRAIGESDCIIAATAIVEDEPVVTRNVSHFERIDGIEVRAY